MLVEGLPAVDAVHAVAGAAARGAAPPVSTSVPAAEALVATVSIGISVATDATRTPGDLYREADLALYRAKDAGRDQYALFDDELRARADRRLAAETAAAPRRSAENLLVPVFQPIIDLDDGRIRAAEALVRIQDGDRLVLPAEFIDVAEETGLIVEVDARMFERVAAEGARLLDTGGAAPPADHQRVGAVARGPDVRRPDAQGADLVRRTRLDDPGRAHRAQPARRPARRCGSRWPGSRSLGVAGRPRRLRHRLLGAGLPAALLAALPQDRPVVRQPAGHSASRRRRGRAP